MKVPFAFDFGTLCVPLNLHSEIHEALVLQMYDSYDLQVTSTVLVVCGVSLSLSLYDLQVRKSTFET